MPAKARRLFDSIASFPALRQAALRAAKGKRSKPGVAAFLANLEKGVLRIERELRSGSYRPGRYTVIEVFDPKHRMVSAAPFRDRVVHHAFCAVVEPIFERGFIHDTYANRKGKGTHRAIARYEKFRDRFRYVLRCDIYRYFPAIDHAILKCDLRRRMVCERTIQLADRIIDGSNRQEPVNLHFPGDDLFAPFERRRGLPIGNLTSQFFSNLYLDGFDHYCKEVLRAKGYARYVDDFVLFHDDPDQLARVAAADRGVSGGSAVAASSGQDTHRAHQRTCHLPGIRSPSRRPPTPARSERAPLPQPSAGSPGPVAERQRDPATSRTTSTRVDRSRGTRTDLAPAPIHLQGGVVRPCHGAWPPPCQRVLRGGSWNNQPRNLRSANRNRNSAGNRNNNNGFRVARTLSSRSWRPQGVAGCADERPGVVMMITRGRVPLAPHTAEEGRGLGARFERIARPP